MTKEELTDFVEWLEWRDVYLMQEFEDSDDHFYVSNLHGERDELIEMYVAEKSCESCDGGCSG